MGSSFTLSLDTGVEILPGSVEAVSSFALKTHHQKEDQRLINALN